MFVCSKRDVSVHDTLQGSGDGLVEMGEFSTVTGNPTACNSSFSGLVSSEKVKRIWTARGQEKGGSLQSRKNLSSLCPQITLQWQVCLHHEDRFIETELFWALKPAIYKWSLFSFITWRIPQKSSQKWDRTLPIYKNLKIYTVISNISHTNCHNLLPYSDP